MKFLSLAAVKTNCKTNVCQIKDQLLNGSPKVVITQLVQLPIHGAPVCKLSSSLLAWEVPHTHPNLISVPSVAILFRACLESPSKCIPDCQVDVQYNTIKIYNVLSNEHSLSVWIRCLQTPNNCDLLT